MCSLVRVPATVLLIGCLIHGLRTHAQVSAAAIPSDSAWARFHASVPANMHQRVFRAWKDRKVGWMNVHGEWVIPPAYDLTNGKERMAKWEWRDGFLLCSKAQLFGVVDRHNTVIVPFQYSDVQFRGDHFVAWGGEEGRKVYYDRSGKKREPEDAVLRGGTGRSAKVPRAIQAAVAAGNSGWAANEADGFSYRSTNATSIGHIASAGTNAPVVYRHDLELWDLDGKPLLAFKQVPFMLRFHPAHGGHRRFVIMPYTPANADLGEEWGFYGFLDTAGSVVVPPRFRVQEMQRFDPRNSGLRWRYDVNNGMAIVVQDSNYCYIDMQGNEVFRLPVRNATATPFNCCGIAAYHQWGPAVVGCRTRFFDRTGREVLCLNKGNMGIQGNAWTQPPDGLIPLVDQERLQLRFFTPAMEPFGSLPLSEGDTVSYQYTLFQDKPGHLEVLCKASWSGAPECHKMRGHYRVLDEHNTPLSSWFPACAVLDPTFGLYGEWDERRYVQRVHDLSGRVIQELDSMVYSPYDRQVTNGLYEFHNPVDHTLKLMNYRGEMLSDRCDNWDARSVVDLGAAADPLPAWENVKVKFTEADVLRWYTEAGLDKLVWP